MRVLRQGGRLLIVDEGGQHYPDVLRRVGCAEVTVRRLDWRTAHGFPGQQKLLVAGRKGPSPPGGGPAHP